ncbi:epoxyqueuosine reductase [Methanobacterium sp.]|uniref:epoxyqueuosine reductase n=1 Tax=Methanobacterium sp. TaxID=2164 RepID=UPI003D6589C3
MNLMDKSEIKDIAKNLGADLCGIASIGRFNDAPKGHHPLDIYSKCKSVIVFAKRVPTGILYAESCIPYTYVNEAIAIEVNMLGINLCRILENVGIECVPIPSDDPSEYWEAENQHARGILSLRHAGYFAGLGVLGKNTLLINEKYGSMIQIGVVLVNIQLESDPMATYEGCLEECSICIDSCPQKALDSVTVNQKLCRELSNFVTERGFVLKECYECRKVCPNSSGL